MNRLRILSDSFLKTLNLAIKDINNNRRAF